MTSRKLSAPLAMRAQGDLTMTQIAEELGVSPASLYRRLARPRQETEVIDRRDDVAGRSTDVNHPP
jgi:transposase-like protein